MEHRERLYFIALLDVEHPQACVQVAVAVVVLFIRANCDVAAGDGERHFQDRVRRLGERRVIVVGADHLGVADVRDVEHADARVPDGRPQLVLVAQRMMKAVLVALPRRRFAAGDVLAGHPPARDLGGVRRILEIVDDEDVADEAFHLGGDVCVVLVHVEAVHAEAVRLHVTEQAGLILVGDVPDLEAAFGVGVAKELARERDLLRLDAQLGCQLCIFRLAAEGGQELAFGFLQVSGRARGVTLVLLDVGDHEVAGDAHLVGVRALRLEGQRGDDLRPLRVRDVDDGRAMRRLHVADEGVVALDVDLAATGQVEMADALHALGEGGRECGFGFGGGFCGLCGCLPFCDGHGVLPMRGARPLRLCPGGALHPDGEYPGGVPDVTRERQVRRRGW